ncbi:MAG: hypothetical protein F6K40_02640 [Okeania sp. SIO3I5]|uniref:hypothetical protein n=1 Tax=Okeania sp. SIO3I5 TaxID=2607805 RepID=UPI0013BBEAE6|nr:hypothetical protein [Okeania sp. SIO3I5]NEQ35260.1 hypothetical protein [Okeania sp. SIO3I5]
MPLTKKQKIDRQNAIKSRGINPPSDRSQKRSLSNGGNANVEGRRERANALVSRDSSAPQVSKPPALRRQNASRDVNKAKAEKEPKPKIDIIRGRMIYPVTKGGVTEYLPARRDASESEIEAGVFVEDDAVRKDPVNTITDASNFKRPTVTDAKTGRTLFATTTKNSYGMEEVEYLPRQSEASPLELSAGKYIPEKTPSVGKELDQPPQTDPDNNNRKLFATEAPDGSIQYYPKKNQATAKELAEGKYLEGFAAKDPVNKLKAPSELQGKPPTTKEVATGRTLFATAALNSDGKETKIEYLPRQSDATIDELNAGKYIPEKASIAGEELDEPPKTDPDNSDRYLFATQGADGSTEYFPRKNQATAQELAEGRYLEGVAPLPPVNQTLEPSDLDGKRPTVTEKSTGRTVYATAVLDNDGKRTKKIEYLPRQSEATFEELNAGKYIPEKASIAGEELFQPPKTDPDNSDRKLFATQMEDGSIEYFPKKNQATAQELAEGRYLKGFAPKDPVNTIEEASKYERPTVTEFSTGRTLFATTTTNWLGQSKTEYLPQESEATEQELLTGKYIPEKNSIVREVLNKRPRYDFENQRDLFAVKADDGSNHYWPKKSKASAKEFSEGRYVEDEAISQNAPLGPANAMSNVAPEYDAKNKRKMFAVITKEGDTSYLPRKSKATKEEKDQGLYIPDDVVDDHESKRRRTALLENTADLALRRAERAAQRPGGVTM